MLYYEPKLANPHLIVGWPGIGNIGIIAVDTIRRLLEAEEFGEIEPWDYFYPKKLVIKDGVLTEMEFPGNKFYYSRRADRDLIFFIGEEQPTEREGAYAKGEKGYHLANIVLDVAQKFGCQRIYTSGAAVSMIHHTTKPRVWFVPNNRSLLNECQGLPNTVLMGDVSGKSTQGNITGLNGLLLGAARQRELDGVCLMGEIPVYLQGFPILYPKASKAVVEAMAVKLGITLDLSSLDELALQVEEQIEKLYEKIPPEVKGRLEQLKFETDDQRLKSGPITEEDKTRIMDDIDRFFKKEGGED